MASEMEKKVISFSLSVAAVLIALGLFYLVGLDVQIAKQKAALLPAASS